MGRKILFRPVFNNTQQAIGVSFLLAVGRQNLIKTDDTRLQKLLKLSNFY
jgi:hypothetical protein